MASKPSYPDYQADRDLCRSFLSSFRTEPDGNRRGAFKYMDILQEVADRRTNVLDIELADLVAYLRTREGSGDDGYDSPLLLRITSNARRYVGIFSEAADDLLATIPPRPLTTNRRAGEGGEGEGEGEEERIGSVRGEMGEADMADMEMEEDVYDVLMRQRMEQHLHRQQQQRDRPSGSLGGGAGGDGDGDGDPLQELPPILRRRYELHLIPEVTGKASSKSSSSGKQQQRGNGGVVALRDVKAGMVGHLVTVEGIVTRCTDVKPLLQVATYTCDDCGFEIYQEVTGRTFMPLTECPSKRCRLNRTRSMLHLHTRGSKFLKFQEARIQEMAEQVPKGHIPRSMSVQFKGELTRKVSPGDVVQVSGMFLPAPFTGFQAIRAGLTADTFLEATAVRHLKKRFSEYAGSQSEEEAEAVRQLAQEEDVYSRLARSIAPEIFGHEDVKKALLLLLVGAPSRHLPDGMKVRGDMHICLMGDPGVAKSQMLKHIVSVAPRGVYTTGRGSSGVGLTAAVVRDPVTSELVLEGGALVLADMGVCAIDEFDKMDESDRTAIHEVMEQQTASIAKAGITTSLNARTSVLAAANPAWGRYDLRRTPAENINLPPALLSRFDLLWLILDKANIDSDLALARHVLHVHRHSSAPSLGYTPVEGSTLRAYIAAARDVNPGVPRDLTEYIAGVYSALRQEEANSEAPPSYTTARTLLSILRLSEALARLRFSPSVAQSDVDEALRLMQMSKSSLLSDDAGRGAAQDPVSRIYSIIRDEVMRGGTGTTVLYADALNWILRKGLSEAELRECLEEYAALNVWHIDSDSLDIRFVDAPAQ